METEILKSAGIDYNEGVARFAGKREIYEKYLRRFIDDADYGNFRAAMDAKDYEMAFTAAHALKGSFGNLSMNRLYDDIKPVVEALRNGYDIAEAERLMPEIGEEYEQAIDAIRQFFA